jgi:Protein of unknown function (DUF3011)
MSLITLTSCRFAFLVAGVVWTLCFPHPAAAQGANSRITCASDNGQRVNCNANTQGGVRLVRQISGSPCQEGSTWGYDSRGIWVDRGCRAEFEILGGGSGRVMPLNQQGEQRRAQITGSGNSDRGKCTIEVVVDGVAEVEIRGDSGVLRNISGQTPQWRRFECTGPMPASAADFRFTGVDGRGRQQLVGDPRNGGVAVVRIEDPQGGSEGYTFDLTWSGGSGYNTGSGIGSGVGRGGDRRNEPSPDRYGQSTGQFSNDEALRVCQDAVRQQAAQRFNTSNITFQRSGLDGNQGRRDLVTGTFSIRRGASGRDETHRFSCALNLDNGRVGSVQIDSAPDGNYAPGYGNPNSPSNSPSMQQCERAIQDRIRRDGYESVEIQSINADNRSGRGDSIVGNARAARGNGFDTFDFSCVVNASNGSIRSVDVRRR